ncbi:TPM domain-containing protein [Apilactobacillus nanyangensis]|uniref:TPM domain-containing protein n=1 Tax=Apilactobacillus nanyangensis TaxID=2799579 RepID=A0ABT0HYB5_9LACO|nr:TPM domain-containing protein [Apilactobacillus nanyangensis]MCK8611912.1 TPM domain-containing protein [Apilactobacillus nanyangensis]
MKRLRWLASIVLPLVALMWFVPITTHAESTNPTPTKEYVVDDYANILTDKTKQLVINKEKEYQKTKTQPQIVVMTVKNTGNQDIDGYSDSLLENARWKFGKKGLDNGVLILFAQNGGKNNVRISTGYGVEDILPDATTNQILQANKSLLKSSNNDEINQGLQNTFNQVATILDKRYANKSLNDAKAEAEKNNNNSFAGILLLIVIIVIVGTAIWVVKSNGNDDDDHRGGGGSGRRDAGDAFLLGALLGGLAGPRGGSFGGGSSGGFTSSGGGGNFGGGGSSI